MKCQQARSLISGYLDGVLTGRQMREIENHAAQCGGCRREFDLLRHTQQMVTSLGRKPAPPDLALRLRVALSQEAAASRRRSLTSLLVRLENGLNAFMVPATAGALSAIIIFGLLIGLFAVPASLQASNDVPTMLYTPPVLEQSPFSNNMERINAESVVVEAYVDAQGRVQNYRVLSSPEDVGDLKSALDNMLIFTVFRPATMFGQPTTGRAILSFANINVKG
ncbi:MAG: zf-HC2 domain-containing protein [Terriglobales bacterium]